MLARLSKIDYSFDAESEMYHAGEHLLGRLSITEIMKEYTRMTQRNAEIFKRDTEYLECWENSAHEYQTSFAEGMGTRLYARARRGMLSARAGLSPLLIVSLTILPYRAQ